MNNKKNRKVSFANLGAIAEELYDLQINGADEATIDDLRLTLAKLWFDQALKMKRAKGANNRTYRKYALEEEVILETVELFRELNHSMAEEPPKKLKKGAGQYRYTVQPR